MNYTRSVLLCVSIVACVSVFFGCGASGSNDAQRSATASTKLIFRTGDDPKVCNMCGYEKKIDASITTAYTIDNLTKGIYYFSITAYDRDGIEGCFSAEMSQIITAETANVKLSWSESIDKLNVAGYKIYYGKTK